MKPTAIFSLLLLLLSFASCEKQSNPNNYAACAHPHCEKYLEHWKVLMKTRNGLPDIYIDKHFRNFSYEISATPNGELFEIDYQVVIDWAVVDVHDQFMVFINDGKSTYPNQTVKRNQYFTLAEIDAMISYRAFESTLNEIAAIEKLEFSSATDAMNTLRIKTKTDVFDFTKIEYKKSTIGFRANGHPYFFGKGTSNTDKRKKVIGEIDLFNGRTSFYYAPDTEKSAGGID
jgi:hypothetical protein